MVRSPPARIPPPNADFLTDLIPGNTLNIDLFEPASKKGASRLHIRKVVHAYKNVFQSISESSLKESGDCNNDINCYTNWDKQSDAVAKVLLSNGTDLCSGSLLNNTAQNFRPFFLSAFHCIDSDYNGSLSTSEKNDAENWMFKFQYKVTECNGNTVRTTYTYSRAYFRAAWYTSDFALMELKKSPLGNQEITWLGWDKSGSTPSEGTGIHHPKGDVMKISFDENSLKETSWKSNSGSNYWRVIWDNGVTEGGSSGSPLLDNNKRVVGQLKGGFAACGSSDLRDWYGAFHRSWTGGGTTETQLKHWLDPCGTNPTTLNTIRSPYISGPETVCSSNATFTLHNRPSGSAVTWSHSSNFSYISGQGTDTYQVEATGNSVIGPDWVKATISKCSRDAIIQKDVYLNPPSVNLEIGVPYEPIGGNAEFVAWASGLAADITTYNWNVVGGLIVEDNDDEIVILPTCCSRYSKGLETITVTVAASNECGNYSETRDISVDCDDGGINPLSVYPNPSDDMLTVSVEETGSTSGTSATQTAEEGKQPAFYEYYLYDINHRLRKEFKTQKRTVQINTTDLKEGFYILHVVKGDKTWKAKVEIRH